MTSDRETGPLVGKSLLSLAIERIEALHGFAVATGRQSAASELFLAWQALTSSPDYSTEATLHGAMRASLLEILCRLEASSYESQQNPAAVAGHHVTIALSRL